MSKPKPLCVTCGKSQDAKYPGGHGGIHDIEGCDLGDQGTCSQGVHHKFETKAEAPRTIGGKFDPKANVYHVDPTLPFFELPYNAHVVSDPEVSAMDKVRQALEPLEEEERERVINWALERFG